MPPRTRRRRISTFGERYSAAEIARNIRWYYRRRAGETMKNPATEEATTNVSGTAMAVDRAEKRIRRGVQWFESRIVASVPTT